MIAITGATGEVGRRVVARLAEAGAPLRLVVRDAARGEALAAAMSGAAPASPAHPEVVVSPDYGAADAMRAAFTGADTVFLIPAGESADRVDRHRAAVHSAVAAGVTRIVYLSFFNAAPDATFTLARDHHATEEIIRATPVRWTFLRMNLYMDFIPGMAVDGVIRGPAGDGEVSAILRDDVAAAAAAVLTQDGHDGASYDLTGPASFSLAEAARLLDATYVDETDEEAYASRAGYGAPDWEVRGWVTSYQAIRDGSLAAVSPDVERLTGRAPTSLAEYLAQAA